MFSYYSIPKGLRYLLTITVAVWILQLVPGIGPYITDSCSLVPRYSIERLQIWRFITYMFLHDPHGPAHILFNMLALWMFGIELEELWGTKRFVRFYLISGVCAGFFSLLFWNSASIIGASGAILALLTVYACYFPDRSILMFFIFPLPVRAAVIVIGLISLWGAWSGTGNIAYITHLGGIAVGFFYFKYYPTIVSRLNSRKEKIKKAPVILPFRPKSGTAHGNEYFEEKIDPILKKISENGMDSLTDKEKKILENFSKKPGNG
jgi:membrane associated rhomboid family serine protease